MAYVLLFESANYQTFSENELYISNVDGTTTERIMTVCVIDKRTGEKIYQTGNNLRLYAHSTPQMIGVDSFIEKVHFYLENETGNN